MAGLTDEGFEAKSYAAIVADFETRQRAAFGADFDTSAESPAGVLNGIMGAAARELWEAGAGLFAAFDRDGATGQSLTQVAALTGTTRRGAQLGRVRLALTVAAGATVPAGSVADVLTDPTSRWVTLTDAVNATASQATVTVEAEQETASTLPAAATTISHIATPVAGWVSVTNLAAASPGIAADTDPVLRRRAETELQGAGTTPAEAIRAALLRVPLVAEVVVWENTSDLTDADSRPPHSVEAMVRGGDDNAIAAVLWGAKARGIATHGATSVVVLDAQGRAHVVRFTRPADVNVWTVVQVSVNTRLDPGDEAIKTAVRAAFADLGTGELVRRAAVSCATLNVRGVTNVLSVRLGLVSGAEYASDLAVTSRQRAVSPTNSYVTVQRV